jgi:hypothetical protein
MSHTRIAFVSAVALGTASCTTILGDYDVASGPATTDGGGGDDGGMGTETAGPITIAVTPTDTKMGVFRGTTFQATGDAVTWSVTEPMGGTVDATGKYLSPSKAGVYHVVATSKTDPTKSATANVTVVPLGLSLLTGAPGGRGNIDGPALKAHFDNPSGIALDENNNLYVADTNNHTIRKLEGATQQVTTLAGVAGQSGTADGKGNLARFKSPGTIAYHYPSHMLYVADTGNGCIRKVEVSTGNVTTLAGQCGSPGNVDANTGAASRFDGLQRISLGPATGGQNYANPTSVYTCEVNNTFRGIRRIDLATGATQTLSGAAWPRFNGCDVAADFFQNVMYFNIAWTNPQVLQKFTEGAAPNQAVPTNITNLGTLPSMTVFTQGLAVMTGFGNSHQVYALSGNGAAIFRMDAYSPYAFDANPYVGVANERKYVDGLLSVARLQYPTAIAAEPGYGRMYVADSHAIRMFDDNASTQSSISTVAGTPEVRARVDGMRNDVRFTGPSAITSDDQGGLYIADLPFQGQVANDTIRKIDPATGAVASFSGAVQSLNGMPAADDGTATQAHYGFPLDVAWVKGNLYVCDALGEAIRKVDAMGNVTTLAGELKVAGNSDGFGAAAHFKFFDNAANVGGCGIASDGTSLYVSDTANFQIRKIALSTGEVTTIAGGTKGSANGIGMAAQFMRLMGLAYADGMLYIADAGDATIRRLDVRTNEVTGFLGLSGQIGIVDGDASTATFGFPTRLLSDGIGNIFVTEGGFLNQAGPGIGVLRRIDIKGRTVSLFAGDTVKRGLGTGPLPSTLNCADGMALTPAGDLVLVDSCDAAVSIIKPL